MKRSKTAEMDNLLRPFREGIETEMDPEIGIPKVVVAEEEEEAKDDEEEEEEEGQIGWSERTLRRPWQSNAGLNLAEKTGLWRKTGGLDRRWWVRSGEKSIE